jgi:hypothetical protein
MARRGASVPAGSSPIGLTPCGPSVVYWKVSHGCRGPVCLTDRFISYDVRLATRSDLASCAAAHSIRRVVSVRPFDHRASASTDWSVARFPALKSSRLSWRCS